MVDKAENFKSKFLYVSLIVIWVSILLLTGHYLILPIKLSQSLLSRSFCMVIIIWLSIMWLIGIWHLMNAVFSWIVTRKRKTNIATPQINKNNTFIPAAILYTTCDDFDEIAFKKCLQQNYPNYEVIVCDDSENHKRTSDLVEKAVSEVTNHPPVIIATRSTRSGFKAGNMNNALRIHGSRFEYFGVVDADEILPVDFMSKCIDMMSGRPEVGFVQCSHASREEGATPFAKNRSIAIAGHWRHFMPARERYGFLFFYGHGAVIRTKAWEEVGGFPGIVSEDLGFTYLLREKGYRGLFAPDIICLEGFPPALQPMVKRTGKWVRGTMEFLSIYGKAVLKSRRLAFVEKADLVFCSVALLLPLPFFLILLSIASAYVSHRLDHVLNLIGLIWRNPLVFSVGLSAMLSPMVYTLAEIRNSGLKVFKQIVFASITYLALVPQSAYEQLAFLFTGKAYFPVTGSSLLHKKKSSRFVTFSLMILTGFLLAAAAQRYDFLFLGVGIAFMTGFMDKRTIRFEVTACVVSFFFILAGIILLPVSLMSAPFIIGSSFSAHE